MTAALLLIIAWLALGLFAARVLSAISEPEDIPMHIDLFERKLDALALAVSTGDMTIDDRALHGARLMHHIETVAAMQDLVDEMREHLTHARLVSTSDAPELAVDLAPGALFRWREALDAREFKEVGIADDGYAYRGPYIVRLAYPHPCRLHDLASETA